MRTDRRPWVRWSDVPVLLVLLTFVAGAVVWFVLPFALILEVRTQTAVLRRQTRALEGLAAKWPLALTINGQQVHDARLPSLGGLGVK